MEQDRPDETTRIDLAAPHVFSARLGLALLGIVLGFAATTASLPHHAPWPTTLRLGVLVAALIIARTAWQVRAVRRAGGIPPIVVGSDTLELPRSSMSTRVVPLKLERVHSASLVGSGVFARLVIDAGWRVFSFPAQQLPRDAVPTLQAALLDRLAARPDGDVLRASMERRHALAQSLGQIRPYGSWALVTVMCAAFALQHVAAAADDPFALLDLGANAPVLVGDGQWYRLISANFLHLTPRHLLGNALFLLVIGTLVERLAGLRHMLILVLTTAVAAQAVSAAASALPNAHLWSVGMSGGIFGLLGALGAISWRFRAALPGGYRLQPWRWILLTLIYAVAIPLLARQTDSWAHAGGAAAGLALGALLCRGCPDAESLRRPVWLTNDAFAAVMLVFAVGLGAGALHAIGHGARDGDRATLLQAAYRNPRLSPLLRYALAHAVANDPASPPLLLRWADVLDVQAKQRLRRDDTRSPYLPGLIDTEAVLNYRLGDAVRAARLEADAPWLRAPLGSHLAFFLDSVLHDSGPFVLGDSGPEAPKITLSQGVLRLDQAAPAPRGARLYAVLRGRDGLAGVLFFRLPPGFSGAQILPLPSSQSAPGTSPPAPIWTDKATTIEVALFDRRGCYCDWPSMGPNFAAYQPDPLLTP